MSSVKQLSDKLKNIEGSSKNRILPIGVSVIGRTPEQSGGEIVVAIKANGNIRHRHYTISELLRDTADLASDLAKAHHISHARGGQLRVVADEILRLGVNTQTTVLSSVGLTKLEVDSEIFWAYVWNNCAYWLGPKPSIKVVISNAAAAPQLAGTFEDWQKRVGSRLRGNPYLIVSVSHAFAAALRRIFRQDSLVLLLIGPSSTGKTTIQKALASLYGAADNTVGVLQMRGSEVGIRELLEERADIPVCLQDTRQFVSAEALFRLIFSVADGAAYHKHGTKPKQLAVTPIVSNERSIIDMSYSSKRDLDEGLFARCFEIYANAPHGFFHSLHSSPRPKDFADDLIAATETCHGAVWPRWLQALSENWQSVLNWHAKKAPVVRDKIAAYAKKHEISHLDARMLDRLAFSAWTGMVAAKLGILPVDSIEVRDSFGIVFAEHLARRSAGNTPMADKIIADVRGYIDEHTVRFPTINSFDGALLPSMVSGFRYEVKNGGDVFLFFPERFNELFVTKYGINAFHVLALSGYLHVTAGRGFQYQIRLPNKVGANKRKSFIAIKATIRYDRN